MMFEYPMRSFNEFHHALFLKYHEIFRAIRLFLAFARKMTFLNHKRACQLRFQKEYYLHWQCLT